MLRRSSRGSSGIVASSSSSMTQVSASSSSTVVGGGATQVVETSRVVGGGGANVQIVGGGGSSTQVVETTRVVSGGSSISGGSVSSMSVSGGSASSMSVSGGSSVAMSGGSQSTVVRGGSVATHGHTELTYETDVAVAKRRLKPITAARASIMFGGAEGSMAMVAYSGGRGMGGGRAMVARGGTSMEARQLAMHLETVIDERQKNKTELWALNERLAEYVEKTRFLEAQNKRLVAEADILKAGFSTESVTLKARYQVEIEAIQRLIHESEARYTELTHKVAVAQEHLTAYNNEFVTIENNITTNLTVKERLIMQLGTLEGELATLRRRVGDFDLERNRYRGSIQRLRQEESDLRRDLDQERMVAMVARNTATQLQDELNFVLETQATKTTEMAGLAYRDTTEENRAVWKSEFSELFRAMHHDYMTRMEEVHSEAEAVFQMRSREQQSTNTKETVEMRHLAVEMQRTKQQTEYMTMRSTELTTRIAQYEVQLKEMTQDKERLTAEFHRQVTRLTTELQTYRAELVKTRTEVQTILDDKLSLEIEIANFRTLLDQEEVRIKEDIHAVIEDQRQVKELMASRGIYEGAMVAGGAGFGVGGAGFGGGYAGSSFSSSSYRTGGDFGAGSFGGGFGGGFGGSVSASSYSTGGSMYRSMRF